MNQRPTAAGASEIEIPGRLHPVLAMLAFLPVMLVILIALSFLVEENANPILLGILAVVVVCCILISKSALDIMLGGKLHFDDEGLTINRFLSSETYAWMDIDACKVMPATGTFGDDALADPEDRVGVGLFLRGSDRVRENDLDADVVICAGDSGDVQTMMRIASRVEAALKRAQAPGRRRPVLGVPGTPIAAGQAPQAPRTPAPRTPGGRRQFNQRPNAAGGPTTARGPGAKPAASDPVAQFRNRSNS